MGLTTTTWPVRQETGEPPAQEHQFLGGELRHPGTPTDLAHSLADPVRRSVRFLHREGANPFCPGAIRGASKHRFARARPPEQAVPHDRRHGQCEQAPRVRRQIATREPEPLVIRLAPAGNYLEQANHDGMEAPRRCDFLERSSLDPCSPGRPKRDSPAPA
jgi:hypothetical protein